MIKKTRKILGLKLGGESLVEGKSEPNANSVSWALIKKTACIETGKISVKKAKADFIDFQKMLGLNDNQTAALLNINVRTVRRYREALNDKAGNKINPEVLKRLKLVCISVVGMVSEAQDFIKNLKEPPSALMLISYSQEDFEQYKADDFNKFKSALVHKKALTQVRLTAESMGILSEIVNFNPKRYFNWLKIQKMKDSESARAEWAASLFN